MATVIRSSPGPSQVLTESHAILSKELRRLTRAATFVALMTARSPSTGSTTTTAGASAKSLFVTFLAVVVFRGLVDVLVRRVIPWPSLFGTDDARLREEDITNRRRAWTWRFFLKLLHRRRRRDHVRLPDPAAARLRPGRTSPGSGPRRRSSRRLSKIIHNPTALVYVVPDLLPLHRELPDLHGPAAADGHLADPRLRARRRRVGRQARPRPRPGRGEGRDPPRRHALAVGRGVRGRRRQARARPALPRRAGHRQDDDGQGDRHRASTRRSSRSPAPASRRRSSASTR